MEGTKANNTIMTGAEPSEVERLKKEVRREHEMYLRALADFDNYRRRVERERRRRAAASANHPRIAGSAGRL
jgi:molecular chaperone GrpE (heat shock protein)